MEKAYIELTEEQIGQLADLEAAVTKASKYGRRGSILGQVYPRNHLLVATFCPEGMAVEILDIYKKYSR